jgi:hypothetical protein
VQVVRLLPLKEPQVTTETTQFFLQLHQLVAVVVAVQ